MNQYWRRTYKVYLIDPELFLHELGEGHDGAGFSPDERREELRRRMRALDRFSDSIAGGEWPRLLLMVPGKRFGRIGDQSFTVTWRMRILLDRAGSADHHTGSFQYYPQPSVVCRRAWMKYWTLAVQDVRADRAEWPREVNRPEDTGLCQARCRKFNLGSLRIIYDHMEELSSTLGRGR